MDAPFIVLGTPRSRTAWLAKFLAFEGRKVLHEPSIEFRSINDLYALLADRSVAGIVDSMLTFRWRNLPFTRIVVVHRPMNEVVGSFMRSGIFAGDMAGGQARLVTMLRKLDVAIDELRADAPVLTVPFASLGWMGVSDQVFRHCLGEPLPDEWWDRWRTVNVQADVHECRRRAEANAAGLRAVYPEIAESVTIP